MPSSQGPFGSKRSRPVTLTAVLLLLCSPLPSLPLPVAVSRNALPARKSDVFGDMVERSLTEASTDLADDEKLFFQTAEDARSKVIVRAAVGETAVLECEAGGSPGPAIHWVRNGRRILQTSNNQPTSVLDDEASYESQSSNGHRMLRISATKSRLYIDCVDQDDAGSYECVAETPTRRIVSSTILEIAEASKSRRKHRNRHQNKRHFTHETQSSFHKRRESKSSGIGESLSSECGLRKTQRLTAQTKAARIYMWTVHRVEIEGADVQLYCRAAGSSTPRITWYDRDDNKITGNNPNYQLLPNGDLMIRRVTWSDHMGLYRCAAHNDAGSDFVTTFLYPTTE